MKLSGTALGRSLEPPTSRKFTWCVMERVKSSLFSSHCPHWLVSLVSNTCISSMCPCYLSLYILCFLYQLLLTSFAPSFPVSHFLPSFLTSHIYLFFHSSHLIPFFTSSSLSLPLVLSLLPLCLLVSLPTAWRPVRFHPLPRKQGLKFKAAVVDLAAGEGTQKEARPASKRIQISS